MSPELVAFDLETTGLSPRSDRVIEVGAVRFLLDGTVVGRFEQLVDPGLPIPLAIQRLTGITPGDLEGAVSPVEAMAMLADFADSALLVAHGAGFDLAHCAALVPDAFAGRECIDTLELVRILLPRARSHSLPVLSGDLRLTHTRPHRAASDAEATAELLLRLVDRAENLPPRLLETIRDLVADVPAPLRALRRTFVELVSGPGVDPGPAPPEPAGAGAPPSGPAVPAGTDRPALADAAAAILGPTGPFAAADPGYELREPQIEMARAVAQTLERRGRLVVEAGTGTGKSLAYLVPLALWTARTGKRAVVATHTITLQEQLVEKDVPRVLEASAAPVRVALLKGREHHVSLRRWQRFLTRVRDERGADPEQLRFALRIVVWLGETATGDRAELRFGGEDERLWRQIRSVASDCLGAACANWRDGRCHMVRARRAAADADIVVTNHALLLADAERQGQVLTPYQALVVDEAQHLEEAATRQLGVRLRAQDVLEVLDRLPAGDGELAEALASAREATHRLFGEIKGHIAVALGVDHPGNATLGLDDATRDLPALESVLRAAWHAQRVYAETAAALDEARAGVPLQTALLPQPDRAPDELRAAAEALRDAADAVARTLLAPRDGHVAWLELRAEQAELRGAPVSVSGALEAHVFERAESTTLTSATLSVAGSFAFVESRTGIGRGAHTLQLPSPFDFLKQALTIVPTDIPPYDDGGYDGALAELVADIAGRLGGRTLVLFTGYAPLRAACALLRGRLEDQRIAVLGQGLDGTRRQIVRGFLDNPRTVLCGTSSFWEGIDVPGDTLRCVVIAKLPFSVPTDPLVRARSAALDDAFAELALPEAVIRLKQGFGRLIRTSNDRGGVVLADRRILERDYGATFLRALPEAAVARVPRRDAGRLLEEFVRTGILPPAAGHHGAGDDQVPAGHVADVFPEEVPQVPAWWDD
ncbi:MAG TPA: helicase C-terminal domain-containing protein [Candidatus Dormibacteraeota bacterium]|nr:helicase C-terminal domain-containing protein [Candidatus Dormibacteraeota bacterium]